MHLPPEKVLAEGLKRWRTTMLRWTAENVAMESKRKATKAFGKNQVAKWENGTSRLPYKRLVEDILPSYHIDDVDVFIDFCLPPSLDDVTVIKANDFTTSPIADGAIDQYLNTGFLKSHRTRIDKVTFQPGRTQSTPWGPHDGHEFVLVLRGEVVCEFAVQDSGDKKEFKIAAGSAIAFPSALYHRFYNASDSEGAELVAARPSRSGIAARKPHE
jgi:quercetin dioxygenase-like cupin family protein